MKIAIVGSGPTAFAAMQIIRKKLRLEVTHIDADLDESFGNYIENSELKLARGNNYPYVDFPFGPSVVQKSSSLPYSFAKGGLSNVWGATLLPYSQIDTFDWPFSMEKLSPYYSALEQVIPMSAYRDRILTTYPLYGSHKYLNISKRMEILLHRLQTEKSEGLVLGKQRLGIRVQNNSENGCYYCNRCLVGCNEKYIWSSKDYLDKPDFSCRVIKLTESGGSWAIEAIDSVGKDLFLQGFERVFLCCGPIESFRILANSGLVEPTAELRDSLTFYLPLFLGSKFGRKPTKAFALSQLFIRASLNEAKTFPSHYQLYEFSPALLEMILAKLKFMPKFLNPIATFIIGKCFIAIGYLHSDESNRASLRLEQNGNVLISVNFDDNRRSKLFAHKHVKFLSRQLRKVGVLTSRHFIKFSGFGTGAHSGAWLRMGHESNLYGEPNGSRGVHVLDASILPSIPAGALTFTVMANAMRIVDEVIP